MAKDPKNFTGENMQFLLGAEKDRLRSVEDWKGTFAAAGFIGALLVLVLAIGGLFLGLFR